MRAAYPALTWWLLVAPLAACAAAGTSRDAPTTRSGGEGAGCTADEPVPPSRVCRAGLVCCLGPAYVQRCEGVARGCGTCTARCDVRNNE